MTRISYITIIALTFLTLFQVLPAFSQEKQKQKKCKDKIRLGGREFTKEGLKIIIEDHRKWAETNEKAGRQADLTFADLPGANLRGAVLFKAVLRGAYLCGADLRGAVLIRADLKEADLSEADLKEADLAGADLTEADLSGADLSGANLRYADLSGTLFEPKINSITKIIDIADADNLSALIFYKNPKALVVLREEFKKSGFRRQEQEITRAIKHTQIVKSWRSSNFFKKIEAAFNYVVFELTCQFGMKPGRPLILLIPLTIIFTIPYTIVLKSPPKKDGIWKAWNPERARKDLGAKDPYRLNLKLLAAIRLGFYFSVLSAFSIGWRELNVGNWISRIQPREYTLRATGWVRTVSGIQSIISVYLIALWALTYFGRPFESI